MEKQLYANTTSTWTPNYSYTGIAGRIFRGKGDYASSFLFLPAAGWFIGTSYYDKLAGGGSVGFYRSSTLYDSSGSIYLVFTRVGVGGGNTAISSTAAQCVQCVLSQNDVPLA